MKSEQRAAGITVWMFLWEMASMTRVSFSPHTHTHTMMSSPQEPHAANHGKVNGNKAVVFRLPPALPASDQTGGGFLPAHMHRPAGQWSLRVPLGMDRFGSRPAHVRSVFLPTVRRWLSGVRSTGLLQPQHPRTRVRHDFHPFTLTHPVRQRDKPLSVSSSQMLLSCHCCDFHVRKVSGRSDG